MRGTNEAQVVPIKAPKGLRIPIRQPFSKSVQQIVPRLSMNPLTYNGFRKKQASSCDRQLRASPYSHGFVSHLHGVGFNGLATGRDPFQTADKVHEHQPPDRLTAPIEAYVVILEDPFRTLIRSL